MAWLGLLASACFIDSIHSRSANSASFIHQFRQINHNTY